MQKNIQFDYQQEDIVIKLQERQNTNKVNDILVVVYGKDYENTHHMINRNDFNNIVNKYELSEYSLKSQIYTLIFENNTQKKAVIRQVQRQVVSELHNKLTLIHLDFMIINDENILNNHPVTVYIKNKDNSQDYKNGCVLHLARFINYNKKAGESIKTLPNKVYVDLSDLSKSNSISYNNVFIASLTKR